MASRLINQVDPPWVQPFDAAKFPNKANSIPTLQNPTFDPTRTYSAPWAYRHDRNRVQHRADRQGDQVRSTSSSRCRARRRCSPRCATPSACSCSRPAPTRRSRRSTAAQPAFDALRAGGQRRQDRRLQRQRLRRRPRRRQPRRPRSRGRATSRRSRSTTRTSASRSRIRAACCGRTTSRSRSGPTRSTSPREWINFFYDPKNAAVLTAGILYNSPVAGVADELTKLGGDAAALVENPLVVPTEEFLAQPAIFGVAREPKRKRSSTSGSPRSSARADTDGLGRDRRPEEQIDQVEAEVAGGGLVERDDQGRRVGWVHALAVARARDHLPAAVLLHAALHPVQDVVVGADRPLLRPDVQLALGELRRRVLAVRRAVLPVVLLRLDRHDPGVAHRLPARVRHRVPRRAASATCCSASSSCRSSRTS